ncbi:TonB-dependent receptor plug domain-containing protein [Opitutus sp. ER46]|uniref:TonB-dependent receptor plug domain-containing protein n=1 Tax=Opitutus sp. ER46 TaxID=2161864 RepID=UPI001304E7D7|nr:TonB-dependent receptor plug domain-containing protein [Opitutus sp. ER46]
MKPQHLVSSRTLLWLPLATLAIANPLLRAQSVTTEPVAAGSAARKEDVIELSPFQVTETRDRGYQATTAVSGTRLNTNLSDLAASLSVVTKQQIEDTASTDINDIFKYELSTEGTSQWTNFTVDRGVVTDKVASDPAGSTRMRGLTSANIALNGFGVSLPLDTYDVESIEISRGPNSTVFGLGNTGGGINIIKGHANTTRDVTSFATRGDSYDGYRGNFDINRVLIRNKLAVRIYGLYEDKGYVRKPSDDITRRLEAAMTYRPFRNTSIYASFESYRNTNNRPNSITPRDMVSDWVNSGKPTWDPVNQTVHLANGTAITGVTTAKESTMLPYGLAVSDSSFQGTPNNYINPDGSIGMLEIARMPGSTGTGPANTAGTARLLYSGNYYLRNSSAYPLYQPLGVSDKSIYDWTSVNLQAPNFQRVSGETSQGQIEQVILNTARNSLAAQAAWLYERISTYDRRFLGTGGSALAPYIDVNETRLDGTRNPYFLRTYLMGYSPSTTLSRNNTESYRATLAYQLDLSHERSWLRWLGKNRFTGFAEYRGNQGGSLGYQDAAVSTSAWMGTVTSRNANAYKTYARYYVGDANGQNVDSAPAANLAAPYSLPLRYYNAVTGQWVTESTTYDLYYRANRPTKRILGTSGGVWQGYFFQDRIIPLVGYRRDSNRTREADTAISPTAATDGYYDMTPLYRYTANNWVMRKGQTHNEGVVVKPFRWLDLSYNQSNSFSPGSTTYDVWGQPLPDPKGKSKDYGFSLHLFDDKLTITAKQYETVDIGRATSELNTIVQRAMRMDRRSSSGDPGLTDWYITQLRTLHADWTDAQLEAQSLKDTGADYAFLRSHINSGHGDASDSYSRGKEIEITYNPTRYWRMKLTGSKETPINGQMSPAVQDYINSRWATWTTIKDPVSGELWWTTAWSNGTIPRDFYTNNVNANLKLAIALQGKRRTQTREYHLSYLTSFSLAAISENRWIKPIDIGGSVRWEDKASIGYLAGAADSDGIVRQYDPNKPVWQSGNTYCDLWTKYRLNFFRGKVRCTLQLNVNNVFENGRLQAVAINPDGTPWAYRIIDPRQFILSAKFDL